MNTKSNISVHFDQNLFEDQHKNFGFNSNSLDSATNVNSYELNEHEAYANIFSTNLDDLLETSVDDSMDEETEELISEAMVLPPEQRERRLNEIHQHIRFLKRQEKSKKILNEKNHRPFDDTNIGLCSVCMDDNFQIVHPVGGDTACDDCFRKMQEKTIC
ncbi:uncharacterized protein LOC119085765 [Bradysia coprophila]|uniref:uncharacterized protein LOC119085765 n=1 Tax=Bradysia coprophila TaxID=38358 RepID=UPI00187DD5CB|nr:uncharacterized protein LOC119085765 [Bradysia coprophila]